VRQVVNAPVRNPRHAGTDEGDRSVGGRKGEYGPCTPPPARGSRRDRVDRSSSVSPLPSFFISPSATFHPCSTRSASTLDFFVPSVLPVSIPFPARSHCPSAFPFFSSRLFLLAAAADAQPVLHRRIDSALRTSRWIERAVLVHGFRNLLHLDGTSDAIVRHR